MKKNPLAGRDKDYFSDTIRERPLPIPPTEDTLNSNLNNDSNLGGFVENFFQSDRRGNGFTEEDYASGDLRQRERVTRKDVPSLAFDNIQALLFKNNEKMETIVGKMEKMQMDISYLKQKDKESVSKTNSHQQRKVEEEIIALERLHKTEKDDLFKAIKNKDEALVAKTEEIKILQEEIRTMLMDKDILLNLIKKLVENNEENMQITAKEMSSNQF